MPRMSTANKYAIQGMVADGKTPQEIARALKIGVKAVNNYIDNELDGMLTGIAKAKLEAVQQAKEKETSYDITDIDDGVVSDTIAKMRQNGWDEHKIDSILARVIGKCNTGEMPLPETMPALYSACLASVTAMEVMATRAVGGREGVTMMTSPASQRVDAAKGKKVSKASKGRANTRGAIWQPKEGKFRGQ